VLLSFAFLSAITPLVAQPDGTASIVGRVISATGQAHGLVAQLKREDGNLERITALGENGNWEFFRLPAGRYSVDVGTLHLRSIELAPGQERVIPTLKLALAWCVKPGEIDYHRPALDDNSLGLITGTVKASAKPVAGARVKALCSSGGVCASALTDPYGNFMMSGLPADEYTLLIEHPKFYSETGKIETVAGVESVLLPIELDACRGIRCDPKKKPLRVCE
jgi:hypothetical protein